MSPASDLSFLLHPGVAAMIAFFFFVMAGYLAGRLGSFGKGVLWGTPILWSFYTLWVNGLTKTGAPNIRVDLLLILPILGLLTLLSLALLALAALKPPRVPYDGPE